MPKLFDRVAGASADLRAVREGARERAIVAVRALERRLVEALDGETLKGLREIGPGYQAARVRGKDPYEELPEPREFEQGREVLVVTSTGELEMASVSRRVLPWRVEARPVADEDFLIEDVEALGVLFERVLSEHIERAKKSAEKFARLEELARQVSEALRQ
jgi:hypothetical protein